MAADSFGAKSQLHLGGRNYEVFRLSALADHVDISRLPYSLKILLENLLRHEDGRSVTAEDVDALAKWDASAPPTRDLSFSPARILMQDFTGVPALVDLAAMRDAMADMGGDPCAVNPLVPVELVIDHSIVADVYGIPDAFIRNAELEFVRNQERYRFLRWGQDAFRDLVVVPPNTGICHQVNLECLARVVFTNAAGQAYPDTVIGTDSHTPMVNGLGVLGWGVGGIEAEAAMLGQPVSMVAPEVVGLKLAGSLPEGSTATDLVLTVTELLRHHGVVGKFVEFYGPGVPNVPVENRATIGNMSPEYGSTCAIFPIDEATLAYLRFTGRPPELVELVEVYAKEQGLWHDETAEPRYSATLELDLSTVVPSLAGPARPQDRVPLDRAKPMFREALATFLAGDVGAGGGRSGGASEAEEPSAYSFPASDPPATMAGVSSGDGGDLDEGPRRRDPHGPGVLLPRRPVSVRLGDGTEFSLNDGHVVIAAITSCTNTSNPSVMIAAGLVARRAVERGLEVKPWVKTSLAPGSKVVMDYYERSGLLPYLEKLRFDLVGYGCTTCIGNSGPLLPEISRAIADADLSVAAVLSGNRNFEGRIHPDCRMNYLGSPPLVVAYALAGTMDVDLYHDPLGHDTNGEPVYLRELWPSSEEVSRVVGEALRSGMFHANYASMLDGDERWRSLDVATGDRFAWDEHSTYVRLPPYFDEMPAEPPPLEDISGARALAILGDSVTTDHISPAGVIGRDGPAGSWLLDHGVEPSQFNSYGSRRGNHEVMIRGTFANIRLRNRLAPGTEGGVTVHLPDGEQGSIYDTAMRYQADGVPLVVLAGKGYGSGSSRDWAAKGTALLGVRAVLAESYERIHRSNLIGVGVLPLEFPEGQSVDSLGLTGKETYDITGMAGIHSEERLPERLVVQAGDTRFEATLRIDTATEAAYYRHRGILQYVLRQLADRH